MSRKTAHLKTSQASWKLLAEVVLLSYLMSCEQNKNISLKCAPDSGGPAAPTCGRMAMFLAMKPQPRQPTWSGFFYQSECLLCIRTSFSSLLVRQRPRLAPSIRYSVSPVERGLRPHRCRAQCAFRCRGLRRNGNPPHQLNWWPVASLSSLKKEAAALAVSLHARLGLTTFNASITTKNIAAAIYRPTETATLAEYGLAAMHLNGPAGEPKGKPRLESGTRWRGWTVGALVTQTLVTGSVVDARLTEAASLGDCLAVRSPLPLAFGKPAPRSVATPVLRVALSPCASSHRAALAR